MKYSGALLLLALPFCALAQKPVEITSKITSVTVYPHGAQIEQTASKLLSAGRQFVAFTGLASELDPTSISVSAGGGINVLSVSSQVNYLRESTRPKHVKILDDSLRSYEFDLQFNQNMIGVYAQEKEMILANQSVGWGGQGSDFVIEDLEDLSDFYRDRLADIMLKVMELEQKQKRLNKNIERVRNQLNEYNTKLNRATGEVIVEVYAPSGMNADFTLSYMVSNAGWMPAYNVNVSEVDQPLQISYNAKVFQNTGVDWEDVTLTLTNANPGLSGNKPELHPWNLYFIETMPVRAAYHSNKAMEMAPMALSQDQDAASGGIEIGTTIDYPVNEAVTQFHIKTRHSIPSNGKPQMLNIDAFTVPAQFRYYSAPKVDPAAFLIASVSGFEQYDLLPGEANLFLANTFVGQMFLDPRVIADSLDLSLGRDQSITVKREKIKEFSATKKVGNSTRETIGIEIRVRNSKATGIEMIIEDQVPISTDKAIEVTLDEAKGARHTPETGTLRWTKMILGGSSETVQFRYSVKYPSERKINL